MSENNCSLFVSSYKQHEVYSLGLTQNNEISIWVTKLARPMGLGFDEKNEKSLYLSNLGHIFRYEEMGPEEDKQFGVFDKNYYPENCNIAGDLDIHDLSASDGEVYYISALFNSIVQPSMSKSFSLFWKPPWISLKEGNMLAAEDRCHLNGMCLENGLPRYVTSACRGDFVGTWRDRTNEGIVYDIWNEEVLCENLWSPHSPRLYQDKLWVLQSGTGELGYIDRENKTFVPKVFLAGFLRGLSFINNYAVVSSSLDRHDHAFRNLPLGKILEEKGLTAKCGLWVVNLTTFNIEHYLEFQEPCTELYEVICIPNTRRPRVYDVNDPRLLQSFHVDPVAEPESEN
jgi:uncharacterized protein (TIGR03032 family)